jgi:hypothetical protein
MSDKKLTQAVLAGLLAVQRDLKAPKGQFNSFGKYKYRSCEDILQAARPLCNENGLVLTVSDEIVNIGERFYIKATSKVTDIATGESVENVAYAREADSKKGMDESQLTGSCSSYARKYSLCGLFAIDDNKDADTEEYTQKTRQKPQEGTGYTQGQKPINDTQAQDEMRKKALAALSTKMKELGVLKEEVSALAGVYYGKLTTSEMTTNEICDLTNNLKQFIAEQTGQTA